MMRSAIAIPVPRFNNLLARTGFDLWAGADGRVLFRLAEKQEHR